MVKNLPANAGDARDWVQSLGWEDTLEKEMATYSSIYIYIFLLYNIVLVLPYINMNLPQVYTCSPS